jgi:hypothetical protein
MRVLLVRRRLRRRGERKEARARGDGARRRASIKGARAGREALHAWRWSGLEAAWDLPALRALFFLFSLAAAK